MKVFDDKSSGIAKSEKYMIVSGVDEKQDVTFKASYIVVGNLLCAGKATALFDLVVFGDLCADEIDVKGRLICLGDTKINGQLVVQNDIWAENIEAERIVTNDRIFAQSIEVVNIHADGNVIIGKTLSVEELAEIGDVLVCGETAYGSGRVVANTVMTVEPLDLDDGEDALTNPNIYTPSQSTMSKAVDFIEIGIQKYEPSDDYESYIGYLLENDINEQEKYILNDWLKCMYSFERGAKNHFVKCIDGMQLIKILEISDSPFFSNWKILNEWLTDIKKRFLSILEGNEKKYRSVPCTSVRVGDLVSHMKYGKGTVIDVYQDYISKYIKIKFLMDSGSPKKFVIPDSLKFFTRTEEADVNNSVKYEKIECVVKSYSEWLEALTIIDKHHLEIEDSLYSAMFDRLMAYVGLKSKYMTDRFKEKGWN